MTADITRRIADTVRKHLTCDCGEWAENMDETCAHVAEEIVKELGLAQEWADGDVGGNRSICGTGDQAEVLARMFAARAVVHRALWWRPIGAWVRADTEEQK